MREANAINNGINTKVTTLSHELKLLREGNADGTVKQLQDEIFKLRKMEASCGRQGQDLERLKQKLIAVHDVLVDTVKGVLPVEKALEMTIKHGWLEDPVVPPTQVKSKGRRRKGKSLEDDEVGDGVSS
ncbi:MAG: hypothetical protein MMC33_007441 [Icmadophila ericetorum]|nr:hypothetical protein [Icmadophila ericetorum]